MRVVFLTSSGQLGGAERVVLEAMQGLLVRGATPLLLSLGTGPLVEEARRRGIDANALTPPAGLTELGEAGRRAVSVIGGLGRAVGPLPRFVKEFTAAIEKAGADIVYSHGIKTHVLAALSRPSAPVVWHLHDYVGARVLSARLLRWLGRRASLALAVSESVAADARAVFGPRLPIAVVHNPVDTDRFTPDGPVADLDSITGLPPADAGVVRVGLPATFARWKGHDVFLRALAAMGPAGVRGYVIGGPVYRTAGSQWSLDELRGLSRELGLDGRVGFTGMVGDMPSAYRALDVVVHASTSPEPFGLVIPEAMATGRAVIAVPAGGSAELFADGINAVAVSPGDPSALAAAITALAVDHERRRRLGMAAREHVVARFGRDRFMDAVTRAFSRAGLGVRPLRV